MIIKSSGLNWLERWWKMVKKWLRNWFWFGFGWLNAW